MKRSLAVALAALLVVPTMASAVDLAGRTGIGYFGSDAPVGIRHWFSPKVGLDLGIGFNANDLGDSTATDFSFEVGVPYIVVATERANLFVRGGVVYKNVAPENAGLSYDERLTQLDFLVGPGAEVFFGDHFALEASHGVGIGVTMVPDNSATASVDEGQTRTDFFTTAVGVSELGFHFYF